MLFGCPRQNINDSSEKLKVICIKRFVFYAIINYQFRTSELKNVEKLVEDWECAPSYNPGGGGYSHIWAI